MNFRQIVVVDFEYEIEDGGLPNVLYMVAYILNENLQFVRAIRLWRGEFGPTPPFDIGPDSLFVAYSAWAEMICFLQLGWRFPVHIFDCHTAYLAASNLLLPHNPGEIRKRQKKGLPDACRAYGIKGWENIEKKALAEAIGNGTWRLKYSPQEVVEYCEEDVKKTAQLIRAQLLEYAGMPPADVDRVLHWSDYSAKCIARIQARGIPIDVYLWNLVLENRAAVVADLLQRFDPSYGDEDPIYTPDGHWSDSRFEAFLVRRGVPYWPRLPNGDLDLDRDAFRLMEHIPGMKDLSSLRDSVGFLSKARLPIGRDGRNRPSLFPFCTATGRNAHARSPYNAHAAVRSFMLFPPETIGFYFDWRSQEVAVAGVASGDQNLMDDYAAGDVYHALAKLCGLTTDPDPVHWKKTDKPTRDRMKPLQLGINYGMGVPSLARGLNRHPLVASRIIELHRRRYPVFWRWREETAQTAMTTWPRRIESTYGWPLRISTSPNLKTLYNFPMQSGGAEMLRLATMRLCDAGIVPIMLVHDGIVFQETDPAKVDEARQIMLAAGREICNGFEVGVDLEQRLAGTRYRDSRGTKMWNTIMSTLRRLGVAIPDKGGE